MLLFFFLVLVLVLVCILVHDSLWPWHVIHGWMHSLVVWIRRWRRRDCCLRQGRKEVIECMKRERERERVCVCARVLCLCLCLSPPGSIFHLLLLLLLLLGDDDTLFFDHFKFYQFRV